MAQGATSSLPVHLSGVTRLCFSPDGSTVFTGGVDCLVRIHKADDAHDEPGFHDEHTDAVTSLACTKTHLITASVDNIARIFSHPGSEMQGFLTRSSGVPIRWVAVDPFGERAVVCGDDLLVKIVYIHDTARVQLLSDNVKSVRSASWDPSGKYLVTASCDGKLRIYDTSGTEPVLLKIMEGVISLSESDSTTSCYAAWHPAGNFFAIPTRTNEVGIINREGWTKSHTFASDGPKAPFGEVSWSPNGKYLAASSGSQIYVWSKETRSIIARHTHEASITGLEFSPCANLIAFTAIDGSFSRWTDPIPSALADPVTTDAANAKKLDKLLDDEFGEDEDMEDKGEDVEDLFGENADDWIVDDDGAYAADDGERARGGRTEVVNVTKAQLPFAPGSTRMKNSKRYLAFNMIGVIDVTDQETHNVVNVEFHDKSAKRGYHFQDYTKYTMASLGEQGIVYAAPSQDGQPSTIYYRPYDSWASQSEWTLNLLADEDALCVAAGGDAGGDTMGSVVVATSRGFVRFLSSSGIQRYLWRMGEDAVTMAASRQLVFIVHREGGTSLDGCQNLRYSLVDLESFDIVQQGRVPLARKTTLSWVGFTAQGLPAIFDSTGLLSVLDRFRRPGQGRWVPVFDSNMLARKQGRTETYWPVGLTNTQFTCIILKGNEKEPWFPRPLIQELDMLMPLLNMDNQQGKLEESNIRGGLQLSLMQDTLQYADEPNRDLELEIKSREVALDKELLQLVQGACKADNLQRALDVTRLMHNPSTIDAASKVAAFYHLPGLQERIMGVKTDVELKKMKLRRAKRAAAPPPAAASNRFSDFAPKTNRRSFGGVVQRDSTPAGRADSFIPETPDHDDSSVVDTLGPDDDEQVYSGRGSPKRQRVADTPLDDDESAVPARPAVPPSSVASVASLAPSVPKNPFAKKTGGGGSNANPFARPAVAKPLDAIKSTSFFDRVDDIETSGVAKKRAKKDNSASGTGKIGPKQATLFGFKKGPTARADQQLLQQDSLGSTTAEESGDGGEEGDADEVGGTLVDEGDGGYHGVLEDSLVQERASPEPIEYE